MPRATGQPIGVLILRRLLPLTPPEEGQVQETRVLADPHSTRLTTLVFCFLTLRFPSTSCLHVLLCTSWRVPALKREPKLSPDVLGDTPTHNFPETHPREVQRRSSWTLATRGLNVEWGERAASKLNPNQSPPTRILVSPCNHILLDTTPSFVYYPPQARSISCCSPTPAFSADATCFFKAYRTETSMKAAHLVLSTP